jgi:hypothetical protein
MSLLARNINSRLRITAADWRMTAQDLTTQRATLESEVSDLREQLNDRCEERDRARRLLVIARTRVTIHATDASRSKKLNDLLQANANTRDKLIDTRDKLIDQLRDDNYALNILAIKLQWQYGALETEHKEVLDYMRQFDDMRQEHDRRRRVLRLLIKTGPRRAESGQKRSAPQ